MKGPSPMSHVGEGLLSVRRISAFFACSGSVVPRDPTWSDRPLCPSCCFFSGVSPSCRVPGRGRVTGVWRRNRKPFLSLFPTPARVSARRPVPASGRSPCPVGPCRSFVVCPCPAFFRLCCALKWTLPWSDRVRSRPPGGRGVRIPAPCRVRRSGPCPCPGPCPRSPAR